MTLRFGGDVINSIVTDNNGKSGSLYGAGGVHLNQLEYDSGHTADLTKVQVTGSKTATWTSDAIWSGKLFDFSLNVENGYTFAANDTKLREDLASGATISGGGEVQVIAAALSSDLDLTNVTTMAASGFNYTDSVSGITPYTNGVRFASSANYNSTVADGYLSSITVGNDATLTLSARYADRLKVTDTSTTTGSESVGTVRVFDLDSRLNADLSGLTNNSVVVDLAGASSTIVGADFKLGKAGTVSIVKDAEAGERILDLRAADAANISATNYQVDVDTKLVMTAAQADGVAVSGSGSVLVVDLATSPDADLSGIATDYTIDLGDTSVVVFDDADTATPDSTNGTAKIDVAANQVLTITGGTAEGLSSLDVASADLFTVQTGASIVVTGNTTLLATAAQLSTQDVSGAGAVIVVDAHQTSGVDLGSVIPDGGVTFALEVDATLSSAAVIGATDFTVEGASYELDVSAISTNGWGIRPGTDMISVAEGSTLRLSANQGHTQDIDGAGAVSVADFVDASSIDVSGIVVTGDVSLERGGSSADAEIYSVTLASGDVSYLLEGVVTGGDSTEGDFILEVSTPANGETTVGITGFASGVDLDNPADGKDAGTFDVLDFSSITSVTGTEQVISKATDLGNNPFDGAGLVVFRSGSAETADTIEAAFAVNTNNNDFVGAGSVNDLLTAGDSIIFAIRAFDTDGVTEISNFWLWEDTSGNGVDNDGIVQSEELTKLVELYDFGIIGLSDENTILHS